MELIPLWLSAQVIKKQLEERGVKVEIVTAPIDDRYLVYILGRGVPPTSNTFRWCTGQIKVEPIPTPENLMSFLKMVFPLSN
jgi:DNA sulfur modification protein DndC